MISRLNLLVHIYISICSGQYDTEWYTYNNSPSTYKDYILVKVNGERVTGFQTNSKNWVLSDLIKINDKINENQLEVSFKDKHVASYYKLDIYGYNVENIINSFSIVEATPIEVWEGEYGEERIKGIERQIFDMTNVYRVNENLNSLTWNNMISNFAKNHSRDMNKNDYFAHDSLTQTFRDRIQPLLINGNWYQGGENLAYGYFDSIIVMNGWYNSEGHRQNLLYKDWKYHGVGVVITKSNKLYATKNFTQ